MTAMRGVSTAGERLLSSPITGNVCPEIAPALECLAGTNGSDHGGRDQWANAGNAHEALAVGFVLADLLDLAALSRSYARSGSDLPLARSFSSASWSALKSRCKRARRPASVVSASGSRPPCAT